MNHDRAYRVVMLSMVLIIFFNASSIGIFAGINPIEEEKFYEHDEHI